MQIQLVMQEQSIASGGVIDYIATLCGIIGGTITVLGYVRRGCVLCSKPIIVRFLHVTFTLIFLCAYFATDY